MVCYNTPGVILENDVTVVLSVAYGCAAVYCQTCFPAITRCVPHKCTEKWPDGTVRLFTMRELDLPEGFPPRTKIAKCKLGNYLQPNDLDRLFFTLVENVLHTFSTGDRKAFTDHFQGLVGNECLTPILTGETILLATEWAFRTGVFLRKPAMKIHLHREGKRNRFRQDPWGASRHAPHRTQVLPPSTLSEQPLLRECLLPSGFASSSTLA